jgi:hypothetical protein
LHAIFYITHKKALASLHPLLFRIISAFLLAIAGHLKAQFICTSVIVSAIFLHLVKKEIQFNEWKIYAHENIK